MKRTLHPLFATLLILPMMLPADDDLDKLLDRPEKNPASSLSGLGKGLPKKVAERMRARALSRVKLTESPALRRIREREPEPPAGRLIYKDDFESYKPGDTPKHWPEKICQVIQADTPGNQTKVMRFGPVKPYGTHAYMDPKIFAANFRLKFDFLCGESGEVTWLTRLHGERGHSLWSNENYYQAGFHTTEGRPLSFSTRHLWVGGGYPFTDAPQPGITTPQPSHVMAWHSAEIVMDDDRMIFKLNGVRLLDGHFPILMARTRKHLKYGFGLVGRDAYSSSPRQPYVYNDWLDNIEIYDLGTPIRERRWPRRLHVAPWGDDANSGTDPAHPWRTLRKAFSELRQGDQLTLQAGSYQGDVKWSNPLTCDLPRANTTTADYPTIIRATPHEQVILKGSWQLTQAGELRFENLTFSGPRAGLAIETATKEHVSLRRLAFGNQSAGLKLKTAKGSRVILGRSSFLSTTASVRTEGTGDVLLARTFLASPPVATSGPHPALVHCTLIGPAPDNGFNCVSFATLQEAARALRDPQKNKFDPLPNTRLINSGKPLPSNLQLPAWADMPLVGPPDLGAVEFYPPRALSVSLPPAKKDILTGKTETMPLGKRAARLNQAISQLRPGDTLRVGPGLWTESGLALNQLRGEPHAPIRIEAQPHLGAVVHGSVQFNGCDQLRLKGFRIAGYQGDKPHKASEGLKWIDCGRTWVEGCEITAFGHAGVSGDEQGVTLLRNWIHHNGTSGLNHGIYWAGEGPSWVIGNTFYGNAGWGFHNHQGAYDGWRGWKHNVHHNLFIGPGGAIVTTGSRGRYYHNTIIRASNAAFWFYNDGHRDNLVANNIILGSANSLHTRDGNTFTHNLTFGQKTFLGEAPIHGDPLFVDAAKHDYRLRPDSPARNAGTPVGLSNIPKPTIGAYDGNPAWAPPKPLPRYVPAALQNATEKLRKLEPKLPEPQRR